MRASLYSNTWYFTLHRTFDLQISRRDMFSGRHRTACIADLLNLLCTRAMVERAGNMKAGKARPPQFWQTKVRIPPARRTNIQSRFGTPPGGAERLSATPPFGAQNAGSESELSAVTATLAPTALSGRAVNVLKILAAELTGENPPHGRWTPPDDLLNRLTYQHLATARNCGPQTIAEILTWSQTRGVRINRSFQSGKSLSQMWQDIIAKYSAGEISTLEICEALEKSRRRKNTRIPLTFQTILLELIKSSEE
jgi:hypothetical protein